MVLKALEKERNRRYETANALAQDLQRFLDHEPLEAGPPSAGYRVKKLVRRYRGQVLAGSALRLLEPPLHGLDHPRVVDDAEMRLHLVHGHRGAAGAMSGIGSKSAPVVRALADEAAPRWRWQPCHGRDWTGSSLFLSTAETVGMALSTCRECGHHVADTARACPSCGVKAPTADPATIAKKAKHLNPWVSWPVLLFALTFGWHFYCMPRVGASAGSFVVQSVNPFTNAVVIRGAANSDMERLGHRLGASIAENELRARAREKCDLWGMLIGYSIRIES